ncbi:hypothetical protein PanWU01x14_285300, partial [Parasponia andersonii]
KNKDSIGACMVYFEDDLLKGAYKLDQNTILNEIKKGENRVCKLAVGSPDNIVALGHVQESTSSTIIHGRELREHNFRVSIEVVLDGTTLIPIPNPDDDAKLVGDVFGSHLTWPKMLVIFEDNWYANPFSK